MRDVRAALRERILVGLLVTLSLCLGTKWIIGSQPAPAFLDSNSAAGLSDNKRPRNFSPSDPTLHLAQLESTEHSWYRGTGRNIFWVELENQTVKDHPKPKPDWSGSESRQHKTETNLKFFGYALMGSIPKKVFLRDGDALFVAREGDVIDRRYKVVKVEQNSLDLKDLVEQITLTIELQG